MSLGPRPESGRARNDPSQYDDLREQWWDPRGSLAMLHWLARARAGLLEKAPYEGAVLCDLGCGAGLLAPHLAGLGYRHVGLDCTRSALTEARQRAVICLQGDVAEVPLATGSAAVVVAGEIFEHVVDLEAVVDETCRILEVGGLVVLDTIADTLLARLLAVGVAERLPGGAPPGIHDPSLFVDRARLVCAFARNGVDLELNGLRPSLVGLGAYYARVSDEVAMVATRPTSVLFQGIGRKRR